MLLLARYYNPERKRTTRFPRGRIVDDGGIQANHVLTLGYKMFPPRVFEILF